VKETLDARRKTKDGALGQFDGWGGPVSCVGVWRIDEADDMSWLLRSLNRILLAARPGPIIWRRAAASDEIWRNTVDFRPPCAIFRQGRAGCAKFAASPERMRGFADSAIK
jgi:hypothetical protein